MTHEPYTTEIQFERAINGWMQCSDILEIVTESLEFALAELRNANVPGNPDKAAAFVKAESRLRTAKLYVESQNKAKDKSR